jgi:transposase
VLLDVIPAAAALLADRGYDADWLREALAERGVTACIPSRKNRKVVIEHDATLYKKRHRIENVFGRPRDWRRVATRYDRCPAAFLSAWALAAVVIFWV